MQKTKKKIEREKRKANLTGKIPKITNYFSSLSGKTHTHLASPTVVGPCALHIEVELAAAISHCTYNQLIQKAKIFYECLLCPLR